MKLDGVIMNESAVQFAQVSWDVDLGNAWLIWQTAFSPPSHDEETLTTVCIVPLDREKLKFTDWSSYSQLVVYRSVLHFISL